MNMYDHILPSYFHIMVASFNAETEHFTSVYESM